MRSPALWVVLFLAAAGLTGAWALRAARSDQAPGADGGGAGPVAVEVAAVEQGPIEQRLELTGTLEATARIEVAAKVGGRLERITVDLGDPVQRGQVVAQLDDAELTQGKAQAKADLAVARARRMAADNAQKIAQRNLDRVEGLERRGIASAQELDDTRTALLQAEAEVAVAASEITRAKAALREAGVRKDYTEVVVDWSDGPQQRVVAERFVDDGSMVAANTPILSVVALDPLVVAVHVTEQDYGRLHPDQPVTLRTDAYPGESFTGRVARIAPVFAEQSRQARVELLVPNPQGRLRPGMFVRVQVVLERRESATVVPRDAVFAHQDGHAVYVVAEDGQAARLQPVTVGLHQGERVQVTGVEPSAHVITLGHSRLHDGAAITVPRPPPAAGGEPAS